jgi:Spy/CpxP family protein refolding chaperone
MTKLRMAVTALGLLALVSAAPRLHADDMDKGMAKGGHGDGMKGMLGLSDDQAKQLKDAREADAKAMKPLMEKMKLDLDSLRVLVDKKASDSDLKDALAGLKADRKAVEEQRAKQMEASAQILTPLQQAKWVINMADHMGRGGMGGEEGGWHKGMQHGGDKDTGKDKAPDDAPKADGGN